MEGSTGENVSTVVVQRHHCAVIVLFLKRHIQGLRKSSSHGPLSCLFRPLCHRDARESRFLLKLCIEGCALQRENSWQRGPAKQ